MKFLYNDCEYNINIIKKNNKNTYIRVRNNSIYVTTNYQLSDKEILNIVDNNRSAIIKLIDKNSDISDSAFYLLGKRYTLLYSDIFENVEIEDNVICAKNINNLNKFLDKFVFDIYNEHLLYWYKKFIEEIPVPNLKIRKMVSRWGVCNIKNNNITLNYELIKYEIRCLDYVIIHELSHFIHHNHSKEFWKLVEKYCPNYKEIRKELKN